MPPVDDMQHFRVSGLPLKPQPHVIFAVVSSSKNDVASGRAGHGDTDTAGLPDQLCGQLSGHHQSQTAADLPDHVGHSVQVEQKA